MGGGEVGLNDDLEDGGMGGWKGGGAQTETPSHCLVHLRDSRQSLTPKGG